MNCYDIRDELLKGNLDLGLFYEDVGGLTSSLTTYTAGSFPLALVASPAVKKKFPDFVSENQELPVPLIINEPKCIFRQIFENYLNKKSIRLDHTIELWSIPTIMNLVKNDVGISYLPRFAVCEALETGQLAEIETDLKDVSITAVLGHHKNKWLSPLMELFIDLCTKIG